MKVNLIEGELRSDRMDDQGSVMTNTHTHTIWLTLIFSILNWMDLVIVFRCNLNQTLSG